jgi:hypothetical protein
VNGSTISTITPVERSRVFHEDTGHEGTGMTYAVELISMEEKEDLVERYSGRILYEVKSEIYGCCVKLLTEIASVKAAWEESFYFASQSIRSHGRLYVLNEPAEEENKVYYDPQSKTCFLFNVDYYGWIKSLALSVAGDILEDDHDIYSVHGACLDAGGKGLCILGGSGAGKTTHTYGLLRNPRVRVVSDDWFYARVYGEDILAYGSEKNFYIRAELAKIWNDFEWLVQKASFDAEGRAVVDLRWAIGKGRILPLTTLGAIILLKRDPADKRLMRDLDQEEALRIIEENDYFNPHLLVKDDFKRKLRSGFFKAMLERTRAFEINTTGTPDESQRVIRKAIGLPE